MDKGLKTKIRANFEEALNKFDFISVGNVMDFLNWTWLFQAYPPSKEEMIEMVKGLFETGIEEYNGELISISSGGFCVTIYKEGRVSIQFILKEARSSN